jgi:hypothetical protein
MLSPISIFRGTCGNVFGAFALAPSTKSPVHMPSSDVVNYNTTHNASIFLRFLFQSSLPAYICFITSGLQGSGSPDANVLPYAGSISDQTQYLDEG